MRLLVPAASAALFAGLVLSATPAVPPADARSPRAGSMEAGSGQTGLMQASSRQVGSIHAGSMHAGSPHAGSIHPAAPLRAGAETAAGRSSPETPRGDFGWPLSPRPVVSRHFEQPKDRWSSGHRGVDLVAAVGQSVLSAGEGVVAFSGVIAGRGVITVRHAGGLRTTYEPVDRPLTAGVAVHRGMAIGVVSPIPGHCVPLSCLHWGAIAGKTYRDPLSLLGFGRPILLPLG